MLDAKYNFEPTPHSLPAASDTISTNVYDAGSAKKEFEGYSFMAPRVSFQGKVTAGAVTQFRGRLVGADDAALTQNVETIADTGLTEVIANGGLIHEEAVCNGQKTAKRYYGLIMTMVGAAGTADVSAAVTLAPQSNMVAQKAAVP